MMPEPDTYDDVDDAYLKGLKVKRVRPAGPDHQVVSVSGNGADYRRRPCEPDPDAGTVGCPWRVDQAGRFPAEAFAHSAETAYDQAYRAFGCHQSGLGRPLTCAGFLLRGATHNLAIRMRLLSGGIDLGQVTDGGHELFDGYREMAVANGVDPDDDRLKRCRGRES